MLRRVLLLAGAATATLVLAMTATGARAATLLSDDFSDGDASGWTTDGGSAVPYAYSLQPCAQVEATVTAQAGAGRINA